jgi:HEAT repeat protein
MRTTKLSLACVAAVLLLAGTTTFAGQETKGPASNRESELLAVLKSSSSEKDKADACLELARIGTKESVAPLAALLGDEKLAHMARYALEPIPSPAVDDALRDALGKLNGRTLVGVIGSIGVRRDIKAADPLCKRLKDNDAEVVQAAARALGNLSTDAAVKSLEDALAETPAVNQHALYEGLFRCAEALSARGKPTAALAIYDRLNQPQAPRQVRDGASRKARILRQESGMTI